MSGAVCLLFFYTFMACIRTTLPLKEPVIRGCNYELYSKIKQLSFMVYIKITYSLVLAFWYWS